MSVDHTDFLKAAQRIRRNDGEIDRRNAASRAYYAAYHRCRSIAEQQGLARSNYVPTQHLDRCNQTIEKVQENKVGERLDTVCGR